MTIIYYINIIIFIYNNVNVALVRLCQMNVNVTIPASLFVKLYRKYDEDLEQEIIAALSKLVSLDSSSFLEEPEDDFYENKQNRARANLTNSWPNKYKQQTAFKIWEICEEMLLKTDGEPTKAHKFWSIQECVAQGINENTVMTTYSNWKRDWLARND